jgi:5-(carboxyamino)imidazole ribonucleotide synthase
MILPPATLGILGGGQLGRYFVRAAQDMGYRVIVLDGDPDSVAGRIADQHIVAAYNDRQALALLAETCDAVSTEFESVPAASLAYLAKHLPVYPGPEAVAICQDRLAEKSFLQEIGVPHVPYAAIASEDDIGLADPALFPGILKIARCGYDGKGQVRVRCKKEALYAFRHLGAEPCVLERQMHLDFEVSVVLARNQAGQIACYPLAENHHRQGILDFSVVPAPLASTDLSLKAESIGREIAVRMAYVGTLTVEFFVIDGQLYVNELAPRPHNSGHYTMDACVTSQFEQQVRALCGMPLGSVAMHSAATMVNLLGDLWFDSSSLQFGEPDWSRLLEVPKLRLYNYGKREARRGRKMGHFTVIGDDPRQLVHLAIRSRASMGQRRRDLCREDG